jgi:hypothetical protein
MKIETLRARYVAARNSSTFTPVEFRKAVEAGMAMYGVDPLEASPLQWAEFAERMVEVGGWEY